MLSRLFWVPLVVCVSPFAAVQAGHAHDALQHQSHSHGHQHGHADEAITQAHVHGEVMLQLAQQGEELVMELTSPAMNLVGFEHRASTPEQINRVEAAEARLRQVADWLQLEGGECRVTDVSTDVSDVLPQAESGADDHGHADIDLDAQFICAQPSKLRGLQVRLFQNFPGVEKVTVQWVSATGAGERILTRNKSRLTFGP